MTRTQATIIQIKQEDITAAIEQYQAAFLCERCIISQAIMRQFRTRTVWTSRCTVWTRGCEYSLDLPGRRIAGTNFSEWRMIQPQTITIAPRHPNGIVEDI
jgi:hypothetical protein